MSIKELRNKHAWSQEELAKRTKLSTRTIQRIEKDNKASLESLKILSEVFNMEIKELQNILNNQVIENNNDIKKYSTFFEYLKNDKSVMRFIMINTLLIIINLLTSTNTLWFIYPLLGWGIPLFYKRYIKYKKLE